MVDAIHTARWISQIVDEGWEILLFPVEQGPLHPALPEIKVFNPNLFKPNPSKNRFFPSLWVSPFFYVESKLSRMLGHSQSDLREYILSRVIQFYKPDLVHSLEMQHAGYLTLGAKKRLGGKFPKWAMTIWGSDIYLFGRLYKHKSHIQSVLAACDYFGSESERDIPLARALGFAGKILPVLPASGVFDLEYCEKFKQPGLVSERRTIVLKGYQHFAGRALVGLRALALCADLLQGYSVNLLGASPDVLMAAELFSQDTKIPVEVISGNQHDAQDDFILESFGRARIAIGLSISDGLPRTLLEAMVMGAYPIQSNTSSADEWIVTGLNGAIVPPEDPNIIADAIRVALKDDALVNKAAETNSKIAFERLSGQVVKPKVVDMYNKLLMDV
jgi:hypothetical protein